MLSFTCALGVLFAGEPTFPTRCSALAGATERVRLVDLNQDGAVDVLAEQPDCLRWMAGNGEGEFDARGIVEGSDGWRLSALGQVDGDGWLDAIGVLSSTGQLAYIPSDGHGGFASPQALAKGTFRCPRLVDLDRDGDLDCITYELNTRTLRPYLLTDAGFVPCATTPTPGLLVRDLVVGDFDGDRQADVAVSGFSTAHSFRGFVTVLHGNGNGAFGSRRSVFQPVAPLQLEAVALDGGDGLDVAFTCGVELRVLRHRGARNYALSPLATPIDGPFRFGDADSDGDQDLLVPHDFAWGIRVNDGAGRFRAPLALRLHRCDPGAAFGDVDGDGRADVVGMVGTSVLGVTLASPEVHRETFVNCARFGFPVATGDFNGDGHVDLLLQGVGALEVAPGDSGGNFGSTLKSVFGWNELVAAAALADFDSDGDIDVIGWDSAGYDVAASNDGSGRFGTPTALPFPILTHSLWADFDGDGMVDALRGRTDRLVVYRGLGGGEFDEGTTTQTPLGSSSWCVADFDGDGRSDVVERDASGPWVRYSLGPGGALEPADVAACPVEPQASVALDVNGDGRPDLVWINLSRQSIHCLLTRTDGRWGCTVRSELDFGTGASLNSLSLLCVDRDPHPDLVAWVYDWSHGPQALVWPGLGNGHFAPPEVLTTAGSTGLLADFDLDGRAELVLESSWRSRPLILWQD